MAVEDMRRALVDCPHCAQAALRAKQSGEEARCEIHLRRWMPTPDKATHTA